MAEEIRVGNEAPTSRASRAAADAATTGPDAELKALRDAAANDQAEMARLKQQMDERKTKIDELQKVVAATSQVTSAFAAAMQAVHVDRLDIQEFLATELPQIERDPAVQDNKDEIEARIKRVDSALEEKDAERLSLEQKYNDEKKALDLANDDLKARTAELDELKGRQKLIQDKFAQARRIRQRITENANKPLAKYVLALELKRVWDETKPLLMSSEQLEAAYFAKADEQRQAAAALAAQEEKFKSAQTARDSVRNELETLKGGRLDEYITKVNELSVTAPV
jgi:hypothetical protein